MTAHKADLRGDRPLRVGMLVWNFPSLSQTFVLDQIVGAVTRGVEIEVLAFEPEDCEISHGQIREHGLLQRTQYVNWHRARSARFSELLRCFAHAPLPFKRILALALNPLRYGGDAISLALPLLANLIARRPPYDLVHAQFGTLGKLAVDLRALGVLDAPIVTSIHGFDVTQEMRGGRARKYRRLLRDADLFLAASSSFVPMLRALEVSEDRVRVHLCGIDLERFRWRDAPKQIGRVPRIISIARLVEKKGIEYAIRAVAKLRERHLDVQYLIVGRGPLAGRLQELAVQLEIADRVHFLGGLESESVLELTQSADLFLAPSVTGASGDSEGMGVALAEAMAIGVPVIASRHGGFLELVEDGKTGLLTEERDVAGIANAIARTLASPGEARRMAIAARARVEKLLDLKVLNDELLRVYFELLAGYSRRPDGPGDSLRSKTTRP